MSVQAIETQENKKLHTMQKMRDMCDRDREKVKGVFRFFECPGGTLDFCFRAYKWDQVERYNLQDGEIYSIPLGVAKHLNKNGWYPEHHYMMDETGRPHQRIGQKKRRFGFQSLEFIDPEEIGESVETQLVSVEELTAAEKASIRKK
jgi:hypothetical protein